MTSVSRVGQVSHSSVSGGGDWDHKLNRLLEDLQDSVIPESSSQKTGTASEYKEFRMTKSSQINDDPVQTVSEKWVEVGQRGGDAPFRSVDFPDSAYGSRFGSSSDSRLKSSSNVEFLSPSNQITEFRSSSPSGFGRTSPKVERKEYYAKSSYTTILKGGEPLEGISPHDNKTERFLDDLIPQDFKSPSPSYNPAPISSKPYQTSETKRSYMDSSSSSSRHFHETSGSVGQPMYSSTPIKSSGYPKDTFTDRSVTPPPKQAEGLKTPPLVRKILHESTGPKCPAATGSTTHSSYSKTSMYDSSRTVESTSRGRPPVASVPIAVSHSHPPYSGGDGIPSYDDPVAPKGARYYTSTTTTEHREHRDQSPIRRFPSPQPPRHGDQYGQPPKKLDELMATFEDSRYHESARYTSEGDGGAHRSHPYGPGAHPVQPVRTVRIDDNVQHRGAIENLESQLIQRKTTTHENPLYKRDIAEPTRNVAGPPVYYPPGQIMRTEEESMSQSRVGDSEKGKMKMERKRKEKEKMKSKHSEKDGGGALPVPVCLPLCCACSIV